MAADFLSGILTGSIVTLLVIVFAIALVFTIFFTKARSALKYYLGKLYSKTSLMLIAVMDVVAAFDPTQTVLGIGLSILTAIIVFGSEWMLHDKFETKKLVPAILVSLVAGAMIAIPTPITGVLVGWFGVAGDKKRK